MPRRPKYGYARNRFGNIQERDSFNENRRNEIYQADIKQQSYDYSCYDIEDDNRW